MDTLQTWKQQKKALKYTNKDIAEKAKLPLRTVEQIMCGKVKNPRLDTVEAINSALGLHEVPTFDRELSDGEKELLSLISQLSDDEVDELSSFIDYIVSKRK